MGNGLRNMSAATEVTAADPLCVRYRAGGGIADAQIQVS